MPKQAGYVQLRLRGSNKLPSDDSSHYSIQLKWHGEYVHCQVLNMTCYFWGQERGTMQNNGVNL